MGSASESRAAERLWPLCLLGPARQGNGSGSAACCFCFCFCCGGAGCPGCSEGCGSSALPETLALMALGCALQAWPDERTRRMPFWSSKGSRGVVPGSDIAFTAGDLQGCI